LVYSNEESGGGRRRDFYIRGSGEGGSQEEENERPVTHGMGLWWELKKLSGRRDWSTEWVKKSQSEFEIFFEALR